MTELGDVDDFGFWFGLATVAALRAFDADADARVAVLTGADPAFCAGMDLSDLSWADGDRLRTEARERVASALRAVRKPVIAAVNGPAITGVSSSRSAPTSSADLRAAYQSRGNLGADDALDAERAAELEGHAHLGGHPGQQVRPAGRLAGLDLGDGRDRPIPGINVPGGYSDSLPQEQLARAARRLGGHAAVGAQLRSGRTGVERGLIPVRCARAVHAEQFLAARVRGKEQAQLQPVRVPDDEDTGADGMPGRDVVERAVHGLGLPGEQPAQLDGAGPQHDLFDLDGSST